MATSSNSRCRTTDRHSIARFIQRALPFEFDAVNELPGLGVGATSYDTPEEQPRLVAKVIGDLLARGFMHSQIVVLTTQHVVTPGATIGVVLGSGDRHHPRCGARACWRTDAWVSSTPRGGLAVVDQGTGGVDFYDTASGRAG